MGTALIMDSWDVMTETMMTTMAAQLTVKLKPVTVAMEGLQPPRIPAETSSNQAVGL